MDKIDLHIYNLKRIFIKISYVIYIYIYMNIHIYNTKLIYVYYVILYDELMIISTCLEDNAITVKVS